MTTSALVAAGRVEHLGFAESCCLSYQRGETYEWVIARAIQDSASGENTFITVPRPKGIASPVVVGARGTGAHS
jgi:hypothetical protein